jgi:hypothetical protein
MRFASLVFNIGQHGSMVRAVYSEKFLSLRQKLLTSSFSASF